MDIRKSFADGLREIADSLPRKSEEGLNAREAAYRLYQESEAQDKLHKEFRR